MIKKRFFRARLETIKMLACFFVRNKIENGSDAITIDELYDLVLTEINSMQICEATNGDARCSYSRKVHPKDFHGNNGSSRTLLSKILESVKNFFNIENVTRWNGDFKFEDDNIDIRGELNFVYNKLENASIEQVIVAQIELIRQYRDYYNPNLFPPKKCYICLTSAPDVSCTFHKCGHRICSSCSELLNKNADRFTRVFRVINEYDAPVDISYCSYCMK